MAWPGFFLCDIVAWRGAVLGHSFDVWGCGILVSAVFSGRRALNNQGGYPVRERHIFPKV